MEIRVIKLTGVDFLRRCAEFTTGHESKMSLAKAYASGHSIIRSQIFFVECRDIPLFVASQLVRSHVGVQFFQRSKRTDRGGEDFAVTCKGIADRIQKDLNSRSYNCGPDIQDIRELPQTFDRLAPTDLCFIINAEGLMNLAHKRLCQKASLETRKVMGEIALGVARVDEALAQHLVPQCVWRGGICPEPQSCGFIDKVFGQGILSNYKGLLQRTVSKATVPTSTAEMLNTWSGKVPVDRPRVPSRTEKQ